MSAIVQSPYSNGFTHPDLTLHELILKKAQEDPNRVALINATSGESMTYGDLVASVRQIGGALGEKGVNKSDVVCVCTTNRPETVVAMLGVLQAGGIITGMNPVFTTEEMLRQIEDSRAKFIITTADVLPKAEAVKQMCSELKEVFVIGQCLGYTTYHELLAMQLPKKPPVIVHPEDLAILPYSSGTTGKPKGVMLTHRNLSAITQVLNHPDVMLFGNRLRTMSVFPLYHVGGFVINMTNALYALSSIVYLPHYTFSGYLEAMEKYKVQLTNIPPPITILLEKSPEVAKYDLSHLRIICVGAAPISRHVIQEIIRKYHVKFRQTYGMTETSCLTHVTPLGLNNISSVGMSLPNVECKIVNPSTGETVNFNEEGEIMVRGPIMMMGYLGRPDATAETITKDKWIHTGDIGYMTQDGLLYVSDRIKEVIKYKSYQVAPAELESVLLSHPDVGDAAVVGVPDAEAGELPRGYIVLKHGHGNIDLNSILEYVKAKVAPYKRLRGGIRLVEVIPKSSTGKILRRNLREKNRHEQENTKSKL